MNSPASDHLYRLEALLATAQNEYNTLAFIIFEGPVQITYYSLKRTVTVNIAGDDVGHVNGLLAEAALTCINALEKEIVEAYAQVVSEADDKKLDEQQLATYRQQQWAQAPALQADSTPAEAGQPLVTLTQPNPHDHSP